MTVDFPFARTLLVVRSQRTIKSTGATSQETRYYLASQPSEQHQPLQWLGLIRGHWGGVENRNHWRRDALMGEDRSRSRNPSLLANLAILRGVLLALLADHLPELSLPEALEGLASNPCRSYQLLAKS